MGRVDIHFHLLAGVDDGAESLEESVALAAAAEADGTTTIVATPHVRSGFVTDVFELPERVGELEERLADQGMSVSVRCGGELGHYMVGSMSQAELEVIANGPPTARWLLVESPFAGLTEEFTTATDELRDRGFGVVVAHPERAAGCDAGEGAEVIRHELAHGSMLQVNGWSLAGQHGPEAQQIACELVTSGRAQLVASDAHGGERSPALELGVEFAQHAGLASAEAERLVSTNPRRLLERGLHAPAFAAVA
jgi:protein-tyrosine phosphatase